MLDIDDIRDALFLCGEPVTEEEMRYMIRMADADAGGEIGTLIMLLWCSYSLSLFSLITCISNAMHNF